jgi:hypothetical protein
MIAESPISNLSSNIFSFEVLYLMIEHTGLSSNPRHLFFGGMNQKQGSCDGGVGWGMQRPALPVSEPKKTGAHTPSQNPLVYNI